MRALVAIFLLVVGASTLAEEPARTRELLGHLGGRAAVLLLHENPRADGSARLSGEYLLLPTMQVRYVEGERGPQLGVTFLKEGNSPILYGRPGTATLQGTWNGGVLKGARYAPGGQERERFEFGERFPDMSGYSAEVRCELAQGRYRATLEYAVAKGRLERLEWHSRVAPSGHSCALAGLEQRPHDGGLRLNSGPCTVTLRDLGEYVRIVAEHCSDHCGSQAYLEPVLVDRGGNCRLLRPQAG
jgi:hypothetical protein